MPTAHSVIMSSCHTSTSESTQRHFLVNLIYIESITFILFFQELIICETDPRERLRDLTEKKCSIAYACWSGKKCLKIYGRNVEPNALFWRLVVPLVRCEDLTPFFKFELIFQFQFSRISKRKRQTLPCWNFIWQPTDTMGEIWGESPSRSNRARVANC